VQLNKCLEFLNILIKVDAETTLVSQLVEIVKRNINSGAYPGGLGIRCIYCIFSRI